MVSVTIDALSVAYRNETDSIQALDHVSLKLTPGRILALVGESGSGKTTLGKALMGLLPGNAEPQGSIKLGHQEILGLDERSLNRLRWSRVAMVFQNGAGSLNPVHRVIDQIAEPLIYSGGMSPPEAKRKAEAHLSILGLESEHGARFPHELSGGQIQRTLMAMALIMDPDVLVLDEPTAALDAMTKSFMADIIRQQRYRNKAILLITHDLDFVRTLADEVAVLYLGQIMEKMPASHLLTHHLHPYTLGLGRSYPTMEATRDLGGIRGDAFYRLTHIHGHREDGSSLHAHVASPGSVHTDGHTVQEGCLYRPRCTQAIEACSRDAVALVTVEDHDVRCLRGHCSNFGTPSSE